MYLLFEIKNHYSFAGLRDLVFAFENKEELKEKLKSLPTFKLYYNNKNVVTDSLGEFEDTSIEIWHVKTLEYLKEIKEEKQLEDMVKYWGEPHETFWHNAKPRSEKDIDRLNQMLYNEIVDKLGLV